MAYGDQSPRVSHTPALDHPSPLGRWDLSIYALMKLPTETRWDAGTENGSRQCCTATSCPDLTPQITASAYSRPPGHLPENPEIPGTPDPVTRKPRLHRPEISVAPEARAPLVADVHAMWCFRYFGPSLPNIVSKLVIDIVHAHLVETAHWCAHDRYCCVLRLRTSQEAFHVHCGRLFSGRLHRRCGRD